MITNNKSNYYWNSPRESDQFYTGKLFKNNSTYFGSNLGKNSAFCDTHSIRINHNIDNQDVQVFIYSWMKEVISRDPEAKFMSYDPNRMYNAPDEIINHIICLNDEHLMENLKNKITFREIAGKTVPMMDYVLLTGNECTLENIKRHKKFEFADAFILQKPVASGGDGTFVFTKQTEASVFTYLNPNETYIVSVYREKNISVNLHAIIFDNDILLYPGSVQIIKRCENRLLYRGCDYIQYGKTPFQLRTEFKEKSEKLCKKLQEMGYRGILGIDAIFSDDQLFFLEINNRFQGSSLILNKCLSDNGLPSLQDENLAAFSGESPAPALLSEIKNLVVPYSMYTYICLNNQKFLSHILPTLKKDNNVVEVIEDGFSINQDAEKLSYAFLAIFDCNITDIRDGRTYIHPALTKPSENEILKIRNRDWTYIKTALLNRGVVISENARRYIHDCGGMREGVYLALDLYLQGFCVNSPLYIRFAGLSPFKIDFDENQLALYYFDEFISKVCFDVPVKLPKTTLPVNQIAFLATDRVRFQSNAFCTFVKHGIGCTFCEASSIKHNFSNEDVLNTIDFIFQNRKSIPFRHVLIGGLSNDLGKEHDLIIRMCRKIRSYSNMPIYLMCIPPSDQAIKDYVEAGVTEFGFNIEIFDDTLARKYMPGKSIFSREKYLHALRTAAIEVGDTGNVRSAFIVGLEPVKSLMKGIEEVCKVGAAPILSVFRPIPGTLLENVFPLNNDLLENILYNAEHICNQYGLTLGPQCPACRNNTLTIVQVDEVKEIFSEEWDKV